MSRENLGAIIRWLYPDLRPGPQGDWMVEMVDDIATITRWARQDIPRPDEEELMSRETEYLTRPRPKSKQRLNNDINALTVNHFRQLSDALLKEMIINRLQQEPDWAIKNGINLPGSE